MSQGATAPQQYRLVETRLQRKLDNGSVECGLCPWRCKLTHGQRGFCQAHVNRNGTLYNLSYGILSAMAVDAIEAKPVRHYRPGSKVLSVGSYGCSFRCGGCHNLEISWGVTALDDLAKGQSTEAFVTPQELLQVARREGVDGIAFTYSEPAVWLEYIQDVSELARRSGLYTVYVSNSFVTSEALESIAPLIDVLCSDIKSLSDDFYRNICPTASVAQVLEGIELAQQLGIHVETRTNVIPGLNDSPDELRAIAEWVRDHLGAESPWHVTRFFPAYKLSHLPSTPLAALELAATQAREIGLQNVYTYADTGCDCATDNRPLESFFPGRESQLHGVKRCGESCCGDQGILLKRYENEESR